LIGKFAFKVHDGVVGDRAADQASHKLLSVGDGVIKVGLLGVKNAHSISRSILRQG
jgi:hypothetical protein